MKTLKFITALAVILALTAFAMKSKFYEDNFSTKQNSTSQNFYIQKENGSILYLQDFTKSKHFILITAVDHSLPLVHKKKVEVLKRTYEEKGLPVIVVDFQLNQDWHHNRIELSENNSEAENLKLSEIQTASNLPLVYLIESEAEDFQVNYLGNITSKYLHQKDDFQLNKAFLASE